MNKPDCVENATVEYFENQDAVQTWINECCDVDPNKVETITVLYNDWKVWATGTGEYVISMKDFKARLLTHGFNERRMARGVEIIGLTVREISIDFHQT